SRGQRLGVLVPTKQPGAKNPSARFGGCGAVAPVTSPITERFSSDGMMSDVPLESLDPPSLQCSALDPGARLRTQPSWTNCHAERSVASGLTSVLPLNGSPRNVEKPTS